MGNYDVNSYYNFEEISILYNSQKLLDMLLSNSSLRIECKSIKVKKGELLISENERNEFVYYVKSGILAMKHENYIFDFIQIGEFAGLYELLEEEPVFNILVIKEGEVLKFRKSDILWKVLSYQEGLFYYLHNMNTIFLKTIKKQNVLLMQAEKKIIVSLINLVERFGKSTIDGYILPKEFTNKLISEYTKCHITTILNIYKGLQSEKAIVSMNKPYIYNLDMLKDLVKKIVYTIKKRGEIEN